jgi:hypothetical protein
MGLPWPAKNVASGSSDCDWSNGLLFIGEELLQLLLFKEHQRGVADGLALVLF